MAGPVDRQSPAGPERVVLFGSEGGFSRPVLAQLLAHGVNVVAVCIPGKASAENSSTDIPVTVKHIVDQSSLAGLAAAHEIPVLRTQTMQEQHLISELFALAIDIMLVACFPLKLPGVVRQLPAAACWNLHPSLLPKYRGPTPLYWQLHNKERHTGVSLHEVTDQFDAGNIVATQASPLPDSTKAQDLNEWVADIGVALFLEAMDQRRRDCLISLPQDEAVASYFPFPDQRDSK